jgi:hypothetical protein
MYIFKPNGLKIPAKKHMPVFRPFKRLLPGAAFKNDSFWEETRLAHRNLFARKRYI